MRRASSLAQLDLFTAPAAVPKPQARVRAVRDAVSPAMEKRWRFSRPALASPHLRRIVERLEHVRRHFPELDGVTIRVGLARARGVLGWGSLDAAQPAIWVRPRRCDRFTIAHELTHLLQARGLAPGGEVTCDLYALARSSELVDCEPSYLHAPAEWIVGGELAPGAAEWMCAAAREAIACHPQHARRAIAAYRRTVLAMARAALPVRPPHDLARLDGISEVTP